MKIDLSKLNFKTFFWAILDSRAKFYYMRGFDDCKQQIRELLKNEENT